jgi:hypothetical protein
MRNYLQPRLAVLAAAAVGAALLLVNVASAQPAAAACPRLVNASQIEPDSCGPPPPSGDNCSLRKPNFPTRGGYKIYGFAEVNCSNPYTTVSLRVDIEWREDASDYWHLKGTNSDSRSGRYQYRVEAEANCHKTGEWRTFATASADGKVYRDSSLIVHYAC